MSKQTAEGLEIMSIGFAVAFFLFAVINLIGSAVITVMPTLVFCFLGFTSLAVAELFRSESTKE